MSLAGFCHNFKEEKKITKGTDDTYANTAQTGRHQEPMVDGEDPDPLPVRTSPSRAQHKGPTSIPQGTGNMGLGWSTAASSHPCFSRLICWFYEIHSPLFSHFSPSLFIAGFIYMNRALRVLSRQSAVAELGVSEGSKARQGAPGSSATAASCPPRGRQAGSPPCRDGSCRGMSRSRTSHARPRPMHALDPSGHGNAAPTGCR